MVNKKFNLNLPVVCTRGVVVFPNQDVLIEVGREKSLKAVEESNANFDGHVLVVCQSDILVDDPQTDDLYQFGTLAHIKTTRIKDNFVRVTFSGLERAKIKRIYDYKDLMFADVECVVDVHGDGLEELALVKRLTSEFENHKNIAMAFPPDVLIQLRKGISADVFTDQFAQYYPFTFEAKQALLEMLNVNERLFKIISLIEDEKKLVIIENEINQKVKDRVEENQKEYYLREKLRAIKEELGDVSSTGDDSDALRELIEENPYPDHVKQKALEELARFEMLPPSSGESGVIRTYLDWLLKTPWYQESEDNDNLDLAGEILDEDHYGLEKVKERILEYLAVKQMTKSLSSPILCLVGPPGVGKTSLAKSIARSLDRIFVKMSLGGVKDESEIRGHRRTYLGSMPGRIIQGMKKAGVINPVFLIDEIDKMASDYKGDPSSAMLEVLDPEQNRLFSDHYLEENYDLSRVLFIATANYLDDIPEALRDRLEVIQLSSYTEIEKMKIAMAHLITKQMKLNGLKPSQMKLKEDEVIYLIQHYTREAGVRQLERLIAALSRKVVLAILKDKKRSITITKKLIQEWLGKERFDHGAKEHKNQIGVVTGLAYTSFGGDILPVEVTYFEGKGKLIVTGQLGDVMKESTEIALDYIKSNAKKYGIEPKFFDTNDIHIHVPEGAVPKDGPSAGITLTTALVSAILQRAVDSDIAMTGEVTLRGNVLPIGGLKEKSLAAHRSGIKRIIFPKNNIKDLDDVPQVVKEAIEFIPVETMDQVLKQALL